MSSTGPSVTNAALVDKKDLLDLLDRTDLVDQLKGLAFNWRTYRIAHESSLIELLRDHGLVEDDKEGQPVLSRSGRLFYSRLTLPLDLESVAENGARLDGRYELLSEIAVGKNSATYIAQHAFLGTKAVVKILRPGASTDVAGSVKRLAAASLPDSIILPTDYFETTLHDVFGQEVDVSCLVFPHVSGTTFRDFVRKENNVLNSHIAISFIKQVGGALDALERHEAYHGDLHDQNILVERVAGGAIAFYLIDISYDSMGSLSMELCRNNDLAQFRQHIWRLLGEQSRHLPHMSLRKYLGTRDHHKIVSILSPTVKSFSEVMSLLDDDSWYANFNSERAAFIRDQFGQPSSFRLQRYEEITDPAIATKLFVPYPELMQKLKDFGNVLVSGNRGSGKSTYLAALAFFPSIAEPAIPFGEMFGVYFPCRQGEFMALSMRTVPTEDAPERTLHVLGIKIIRRTLEALSGGIASGRIRPARDIGTLIELLNRFVPEPGIVSVDASLISEIDNIVLSITRLELQEVEAFARADSVSRSAVSVPLLISFFELVRETFVDLTATRFNILFDDAGAPYTPPNVQRAINDLILASNAVFCVKLTAEKYTFEFLSSTDKVPENGNDYVEYDISAILFIGSKTFGLDRKRLEEYFRNIIEQRLVHFGYTDTNIAEYLGDNPNAGQLLKGLLAAGRKDAYYAGWSTVWNVADRTPRNLLEIVSEIFAVGGITPNSKPHVVPMRDQDRAIRTISEKRLQSLSQIAGSLRVGGQSVSVGRQLFEITATIGSTFRAYLRMERGKPEKRQHLAIERNDSSTLSEEAEWLLHRLETYGVLDASRTVYARDDERKKPLYVLNRIYCPAFNISFVRDDHLRLSRSRLEMLLLAPETFAREGTTRLRNLGDAQRPSDLFGFDVYE